MARQQASLKDLFARQDTRQPSESSDTDSDHASVESDSEEQTCATPSVGDPPGDDGAALTIPTAAATASTSEIISAPNQPRHQHFPSKVFGKQKRSFNSKWFDNDKWASWLHWEEGVNKAFCYICKNVFKLNQLKLSKSVENAFISVGFDNWKRATSAFEQHRRSKCHRESVLKWNHHLKGNGIQAQLDKQAGVEQKNNLHCLEIIFSSIEYLARQGLPLRGHDEHEGNFFQLIKLRANDNLALQQWMERKRAYLSHEIQNEF